MRKLCKRCGEPKQPGRTTYCSDTCAAQAVAERMAARAARRMSGCRRCGAAKTPGIRGSKFCDECRRIVADQHTAHEAERKRRDHLASMEKARGERVQRRRTADVPDGQKWCPRCQDFRPLTSFPKRADRPVAAYCKPCQRAYNSERRLKLNFGLTWDEYDRMLMVQDGRCAICNGRPRRNSLAVDHDHKTGEIRGLLCSRCNHKLLGSANEDPARLRRAANYLEQYEAREVFGQRRFVPGFGHPDREPLEDEQEESA